MKKKVAAFLLLISTLASAQEVPAKNPDEVWVKGRRLTHSWKDGRILVPTSELQPILNLTSEYSDMDLLEALEEKGDYLWTVAGGKFEAKRDPSKYSQSVAPGQAVAANRKAHSATRPRPKKSTTGIGLQYKVDEYMTDWGYKWGRVEVTNISKTKSDVCTAYCHFQDNFGHTYAEDWWPVRPLEPGETMSFEIASGKRIEDTPITPTSNNVMVYFFSEEDVSKNPTSMREAQKQSKAAKKKSGIKSPTLDFRRNAPVPSTTTTTTTTTNPMQSPRGW